MTFNKSLDEDLPPLRKDKANTQLVIGNPTLRYDNCVNVQRTRLPAFNLKKEELCAILIREMVKQPGRSVW